MLKLQPLFLFILACEVAIAFQPLPQPVVPISSTQLFRKSDSKWDNLVDEEDEDQADLIKARPDMKYLPRNIQRQHQNFVAIKTLMKDL